MTLRAATLNVWSLPGPLAKHKPQRMQAIGERVAELDLDVVAFQEVWTHASRVKLIEGTARCGLTHVWHRPGTRGGSGLLVASKWPVSTVHFEPFIARGHAEQILHMDYYSGKGFVVLELETDLGPVALLNTHLHANYALPGQPDEYKGVRGAQVIQLVAALSDIRTPLVAMGDFNLGDSEDSYRVLRDLGALRDVATERDARQPTSLTDNPYHRLGHREKRIDYVFCRDGARVGLRPNSIERDFDAILDFDGAPGSYSDHAGLVSEFEVGAITTSMRPDRRAAAEIAARLIERGRDIAHERRSGQRTTATGALALGLVAGGTARNGKQARRRFLKNSLGFASGLSFAILAQQVGLSEWVNPDELAAYDHAEMQLAKMQAERRRS